jgi:hypothetical protein
MGLSQHEYLRVTAYEVRAREEFPPRTILKILRADGASFECECEPGVAHKLSDDLLKAEAASLRQGVPRDPEDHARTV